MRRGSIVSFVVFVCFLASVAYAGQATSSISGVVVDSAGGVIPGAAVVVTSPNGTKFETVSNSTGAFNVPALQPGTYSVTVTLQGFKSALVTDVRIQPGTPANLKVTLEVGGITEKVTVAGASSELINTRTATVSSTLNVDQIAQLPTATRDLLLGGVTMLTGVNFTGEARGNATVNGLPESFLNITLDGVTNNDNFNKSTDGFFAPVRPRQDAIEAVTVTTAAGAADQGGHGAVTINFTTRSGTNRFSGSLYEYYRDTWMNTNYWFNENRDFLAKNDVRLNQFGYRLGGPIIIPKVFNGSGKAFFFYNHEFLRLPNDASRTRTILHPRALQGFYRYNATVNGQVVLQEVNVLALGAPFSTPDPSVLRVLNGIQAAVQKTGTIAALSDPMLLSYNWRSPAKQVEHQPAIRLDYNITTKHRLSYTFNKLFQDRNPDQFNDLDQRFPDSPNFSHTVARRPSQSITLRSALSQSMVSEFRVGITAGETIYFGQVATGGPSSFADQDGYALTIASNNLTSNPTLTNWHTSNTLSGRSAYAYSFDENLNWQRGKHVITAGGQVFLGRFWDVSQMQVPGITFGLDTTNDPAASIINNPANYPGNPSLAPARQLYALLTGRVASITGQAALNGDTNQYEFLGNRRRGGKLNNYAMFLQDSWRLKPTVTVNGGLRWDLQTPFQSNNDIFSSVTLQDICGISGLGDGSLYGACKFFTPNASGGKVPVYSQLVKGTNGYNIDWNNVSPNINVAWRPNVQSGFLRTILGDPEQATVRGGFSVQFERQGFGAFTGVYGGNPGSTLALNRNANSGLVPAGEPWPILFSQKERLYPAAFPASPTYPIALRPNRADSISGFHPDIQVASARTWTLGLQRAVSRDMAVEVRYVGTRGVDQWSSLNYNERNMIENGFYDEFLKAMANYQAHRASGCTTSGANACSFAYRGPGTGTSPLPIYLAYLSASTNPGTAAAYTGTGWTNTALLGRMIQINPNPLGSASDLVDDSTRRANAIAAGYPANFFIVNPDANAVNVTDSGAFSDYHALQLEVRRRLSKGLSANVSYQYAREGTSAFLGFHYGRIMDPQDNVRHAIKGQWDWTIPVGRGERFGADMNPYLNGVIGGWSFTGSARIQARMVDFGNVRMVGMTADDVQSWFKFRITDDPNNPGRALVLMAPDDVILNTRRAFSFSTATASGYSGLGDPTGAYFAPQNSATCIELKVGGGDCGPRNLLIRAPFFTRVDVGMTKRFPLATNKTIEIRVDVLNLFDNVNFNPVGNPGSGATIFQVTSAYRDIGNNFDPGGRLGQLSIRFNW